MLSKANVGAIVSEHLKTFRNFSTDRISLGDMLFFFGIPLAACTTSILFKYDLSDEARSALVNASAIFLGMMLNLLVLMFDQQNKNTDRVKAATDDELRGKLEKFRGVIDETIANISFTTLLCILALLLLIIHSILLTKSGNSLPWGTLVISSISLGIWVCILLTSMMVLKRVFSLLINDKRA